ncbi:spliceosome-associated protein CWC27 homolog [Anabrus simplex]|uniref:spliceosome-associated protein CWC27 homolog n=1 Tax=Anabrus simplex TaxID=316456 RepID=UPI0035A2C50A
MSNIYIQEPPTNGKVLLKTTVGDIDLELWSKEAPKACRNFVQLCLEGYYNQTIFHRVVKNFIVQGGDPTGTGTGGESIYGEPFKDEFHSRLRFNRRGLVAMANAGQDDNASQFFFTLAATPELQNKHTIFAKVTRETIFNVLKLQETLIDKDERPLYPQKIIKAEVLHNPFPDIVPRVLTRGEEKKDDKKRKDKRSGVKNFKLLSFGEEAEEDEEAISEANKKYSGRSKSTHDLLNDPKLSATPAIFPSEISEKKPESEENEEEGEQVEMNKSTDLSLTKDAENEHEDKEIGVEKTRENETKVKSKRDRDDGEHHKETERSVDMKPENESHRRREEKQSTKSGNHDSSSKPRSEDKRDHHNTDDRQNEEHTEVVGQSRERRRLDLDSKGKSRKRTSSNRSEESEDHLSGDEGSHRNPATVSQTSMENLRKKLKGDKHSAKSKNSTKSSNKEEIVHEEKNEDLEKTNIRKEIKALKRELHASKQKQIKESEEEKNEKEGAAESKPINEYIQYHQKYKTLKNQLPSRGSAREEFTMALLSKFQMRLAYAKDKVMERNETEEQSEDKDPSGEDDGDDWLTHKLQFESHTPNPAKDASTKTDDWFEIYDPRNPINKRRREASKESMRQKERH